MARTIQTRKRSRFAIGRPIKRRRLIRRRRFTRRGRRLAGLTNRNSNPVSVGRFLTRKTPGRVYRRWLWQSTMDKSHYRSVGTAANTAATPANLTDASLTVITPGNAFWTAAGGAQQEDTGVAVPTFIGDIVLRGGVSRLTVSNRVDPAGLNNTDCVRVTVFTVWTNRDLPGFAFPATVPVGWDPSVFPDFQRHGRVIGKREVLLKPDGEVMELYFRHRIQKIDQNVYTNGGSRLNWFVLNSQVGNSDAGVPENVDIVNTINYSFSADAQ